MAESIPHLIEYSLSSHPSLKAIELRISAMDEQILKSAKWENPNLSLAINDIHYGDISNRSLEPMQYSAIRVKQKFPWFNKLDAKGDYQRAKKMVLFDSLESAEVKLAQSIRVNSYRADEVKQKIEILQRYTTVVHQTIKLYNNYNTTQSNRHSGIVEAEIMLSQIKIKLSSYTALQKRLMANLEYLTQRNIRGIEIDSKITKPNSLQSYLQRAKNNRNYHIKVSQTRVASKSRRIKELDRYADPFIEVGHFSRSDYPDYASIKVGLSLPIYGSEELDIISSHKEELASKSLSIDYLLNLKKEIKSIYARVVDSYNRYNILTKETLPQIAHLFELNSASVESGEDMLGYNRLLLKRLDIEEQIVETIGIYRENRAKLKALIGEKL
jgi:hypothetical protein